MTLCPNYVFQQFFEFLNFPWQNSIQWKIGKFYITKNNNLDILIELIFFSKKKHKEMCPRIDTFFENQSVVI